MNGERTSFRIANLLALTFACSLFGCSMAYDCEVSGKVIAFSDGTPLEGVRVVLKDSYHEPVTSGPDGSFVMKYRAPDIAFDDGDKWTLTLSKEGYSDQIVEIDPPSRPESGSMAIYIVIAAYMKANQ